MEKETKISCYFMVFIFCFSIQGLMSETHAEKMLYPEQEASIYLRIYRPQNLRMKREVYEKRMLVAKEKIEKKAFLNSRQTQDLQLIY
jgi:hypothetical protein